MLKTYIAMMIALTCSYVCVAAIFFYLGQKASEEYRQEQLKQQTNLVIPTPKDP